MTRSPRPRGAADSGMGLLGALVLAGVCAALGMLTFNRLNQNNQLIDKTRDSVRQRAVLRHISTRLDCDLTMTSNACRVGGQTRTTCNSGTIALRDTGGNIFVPRTGAKFGQLQVRACCSDQPDPHGGWFNPRVPKLLVEVRTGQSGPWEPLFGSGPGENPCGQEPSKSITTVRADIFANPLALVTQTAGCLGFYSPAIGNELYLPVMAMMQCPAGLKAIGSGIDCRNLSILPIYPSHMNQYHPSQYTSGISVDSNQFAYGFCCVQTIPTIPIPFAPKRAELYCAP